jgi:hypothetical protein
VPALDVGDDLVRVALLVEAAFGRDHKLRAAVGRIRSTLGRALGSGFGDYTTSDVEDVMGHPPRPFAEFARDHVAALRPRESVLPVVE